MPRPKKPLPSRLLADTPPACEAAHRPGKLATLIALLQAQEGATIATLCAATGWQSHSVRGAIAGSLKRKGHHVTSIKPEQGPRIYRIGEPA